MPPLRSIALRRRAGVCRAGCLAVLVATVAAAAPPQVMVSLDDGTSESGGLVAIDGDTVEILAADGAARSFPVGRVRSVVGRRNAVGDGGPAVAQPPAARLTLTDGTTLSGTSFSTAGDAAIIGLAGGEARMPLGRVRSVEFLAAGPAGGTTWLAEVLEGVSTDLVAVAKGEAVQLVECAILGVDAESVTISLDEETIPVKRTKVIGLRWLRAESPAAGTTVEVVGGRLRAGGVAWSPAAFVLDGADPERKITLPPVALAGIDYTAGRTVALATLPPERLEVEPFFGGLDDVAGLAACFAPRPIEAGGSVASLLVRPRTVATWRIPTGGRRFRAGLAQATQAGPATVSIAVDGKPLFEGVVSGEAPVPVDVAVAGGRRLTLAVDFGPAGAMAGAVRLVEPVIDQ